MAASITALPPLTCTARGRQHRQLLFLLRGRSSVAVVSSRPVPGGESAGCVCLQCCSAGFCLPVHPLPAMPTALISSCPRSVCFKLLCPIHLLHCALPRPFHFASVCFPCSLQCAPGSVRASSLSGPAVCKLRELSRWQLQHGPAVAARAPVYLLTYLFPAESMILGHGSSVEFRLRCTVL